MGDEEFPSPKQKSTFKRPAGKLSTEDESDAPKTKKPKTLAFSPMALRLGQELKKSRKGKAPAEEPAALTKPAKSGRGSKAKEVAVSEPSEANETKPEKIAKAPKVNKTQELINVIHRTINSIP